MVEKKKMIRGILEIIAEYNRVQYEYGKEYRQYGTDHLLRHDQVLLINYIGQNPECNLRFLADTIGLGLPTVSLQIKKLEKMGLVLKRRSDESLRELKLNLTDAGWKVFHYHQKLDERFMDSTMNVMNNRYSEEELKVVKDFTEHILMNKGNLI